ncbi:chitin deacetylase [Ceratobasidium sp. AG-Ba]|nr:chitin deacetylase [Ceratobasidium sp. AG-Ba]
MSSEFLMPISLRRTHRITVLHPRRLFFRSEQTYENSHKLEVSFDDGPYYYSYDISKALIAAGGRGTFFLNGNNYNTKRVKYLYDKGHQIASHTWSHANLSTLSWDQVHDEMWRVELAMQKIAGVVPAVMRPPYGEYNGKYLQFKIYYFIKLSYPYLDNVKNVAGARGQSIAMWDFDNQDSLGASPAQSKQLYDEAIAKRPSTILALNHEVHEGTAHEVVPYAIQKLAAAGYKLVTLSECLGDKPAYQSVGKPSPRDDSWHC